MTLQETELLVAGIPCIDVSSAGNRKGASGPVGDDSVKTSICEGIAAGIAFFRVCSQFRVEI